MSLDSSAGSATATIRDRARLGAVSEPGDEAPPRQCGRCRSFFAGGLTVAPFAQREWWLCPACHKALVGRDRGRS
jgi:hypothetical protein